MQRQKNLLDNVNIDWNLSHDEGSTDFSDDETIIEDRVSKIDFTFFNEKVCVYRNYFI